MNEYIRAGEYVRGGAIAESGAEKAAFLRKVYGYFTGSVLASAAGAMVALHAGADVSQVVVRIGRETVVVPPLVAFFSNHWIVGLLLFLGAIFGASYVRERPGINVAALLGAGFISGVYIAPMLWLASTRAAAGLTLTSSPVRDAFLLASLGFGGLTGYAMLSRKDFSFLGGFVSMGIWIVIGAGVLNLFLGSSAFSLPIASVSVLLFGAYTLYDTSRILRDPTNRDPVGAAIGLYLNFLNLFLALLRILSGRREA